MEERRWILNRPDLKKRISKGWGRQNPGVLTRASADKRGLGETGVWRSSLGVPGAAVGAGPRESPRVYPGSWKAGSSRRGTKLWSRRGTQKARDRDSECFSNTPETWIRSVIFRTRSLPKRADISPFDWLALTKTEGSLNKSALENEFVCVSLLWSFSNPFLVTLRMCFFLCLIIAVGRLLDTV